MFVHLEGPAERQTLEVRGAKGENGGGKGRVVIVAVEVESEVQEFWEGWGVVNDGAQAFPGVGTEVEALEDGRLAADEGTEL